MRIETTMSVIADSAMGQIQQNVFLVLNKSSAVAEMGNRLATIDMARKVGLLCLLPCGELDPNLTQCP